MCVFTRPPFYFVHSIHCAQIGSQASVSNKSRGISARTELATEAGACGIAMTWTVQRAAEITADAPRERWLAEHVHQHDQVASALKLAGGTQGATDRYIMQHSDTPSAGSAGSSAAGAGGAFHASAATLGVSGNTAPSPPTAGSVTSASGATSGRSSPEPSTSASDSDVAGGPSRSIASARRGVSSLRLPSAELDTACDDGLRKAFNDLHGTKRMLNWLVAGIEPANAAQRSDRLVLRDSGADPLMALVPSAARKKHSSVFQYTTDDTDLPVYIYLRFNRHVPTSTSSGPSLASGGSRVPSSPPPKPCAAGAAAGTSSPAAEPPGTASSGASDSPSQKHRRGQSVSLQRSQDRGASATPRSHRHSVSMGVSSGSRDAHNEIPWSQYATKGSATATFVLITWNPPSSSNTMMLQHRRAVSKRFPHHVHLTVTGLADLNARNILSRIRHVLNMNSVTLTLEIIPPAALQNPGAIHAGIIGRQGSSSSSTSASSPTVAATPHSPGRVEVRRVQLEIPEGYTLGALRQDISTQLGIPIEHQRVFQLRKFTGSSRAEELAESVAHLRAEAANGSSAPDMRGRVAEISPSDLHSAAIHSVLGRDPQPPTTAASLVVGLADPNSSIQNTVTGGDTLFIQIVDDSVAHLLPVPADAFSLRQTSNVSEAATSSLGIASPARNRADSTGSLQLELPVQAPSMHDIRMPPSPVSSKLQGTTLSSAALVLSPCSQLDSDDSNAAPAAAAAPTNGAAVASPVLNAAMVRQSSSEVMSDVISRVHAARIAEVREVEEERRSTMLRRHENLMSTIKKLKGMKMSKPSLSKDRHSGLPSVPEPSAAGSRQEVDPAAGGQPEQKAPLAPIPGGAAALASQLRLQRASLRKITPQNLGDALAEAADSEDALSHALSSLGGGSSLSQGEADEVASTLSAHMEQLREEVSYLELQMNELKITEPAVGEGATASVYRALWVSPGAADDAAEEGDGISGSNMTESGARFITDPGVEVALKKFNYVAAQPPPKALKEFKTEVAALRKLPPHPNVVRLIGACTNPGMAIVYEYMPQGTLFHALRSQLPLSLRDRLNLALDCAKGLQHLHNNSILHRDIKSHNILLDLHQGRLRAKLGDLGCSRVLAETGDEAMAKTELGTAGYVAPEVLYGVPYAFPADVFSLGVLLFELFAPAQSDGRINLPTKDIPIGRYCMEFDKGYCMQWPKNTVVGPSGDVPDWVLPLVHACMQADPAKRLLAGSIVQKLEQHGGSIPHGHSGAAQ